MMLSRDLSADVHSIDRYGASPLHYAAVQREGEQAATIRALLDAGADPFVATVPTGKDRVGDTALDIAKRTNNSKVAAVLAAAQTGTRTKLRKHRRRLRKSEL